MAAKKITLELINKTYAAYIANEQTTRTRNCVHCVIDGKISVVMNSDGSRPGGHVLCKECMGKMPEFSRHQINEPCFRPGSSYAGCGGVARQMIMAMIMSKDENGQPRFEPLEGQTDIVVGPVYMDQEVTKEGPPRSFFGVARLGKQPRRIAAEIEVAHTNGWTERFFVTLKKWNCAVVQDGSLSRSRGKRGASFEINTAPASGEKWVEMVTEVATELRAIGGRANWSCGTHIHVDATKNFGWWDMRRLVRLYAKVEPGMYDIIDPSRRKSTYAIPCGAKLESYFKKSEANPTITPHSKIRKFKEAVSMGMYGVDAKSLSNSSYTASKGHSSRYMALNLHSWFYRGTVEFRHSHGITHPEKIINWGLMCASIIDSAANLTEAQVDALPPGVPGLVAIAPSDRVAKWILKREAKFKNYVPKIDPEDGRSQPDDSDGDDDYAGDESCHCGDDDCSECN